MKKNIILVVLMLTISIATSAQQKKAASKPTNNTPTKVTAKPTSSDPKNLQDIWTANAYLAKKLLEVDNPVVNKEEIRSFIGSEITIKQSSDLTSYLQKFYSLISIELINEEKKEEFKSSVEQLNTLNSSKEIIDRCLALQQCIRNEFLPKSWDDKEWLLGFKNIK